MTVRANKQPVNLKEKLLELERPIGLKGSELMGAETAQDARDFVSAGRKNMVINGDMSISQRGTSFVNPASTANGYYTLDRFSFQASNTNYTVTQDTSGPHGFSRSLKVTMGTATGLDYMRCCHLVEGYNFRAAKFGTSSAKYLTLSFWVKSSLTGKFAVGFRNGDNLTTNIGTSFVTTYDIHNSDVWEYKTVLIPPNTNGGVSWNTGIALGMAIMWDLGDSANRCQSINSSSNSQWQTSDTYFPLGFDESTKLASFSSATWQITGVQLEVGRNATEFEHRSYGEELALCQRYYQRIYYNTSDYPFGYGYIYNNTNSAVTVPLPNSMRPVGAINFANLRIRGGGAAGTNDSVNVSGLTFASDNGSKNGLCQLNVTHSAVSGNNQNIGATCVLTNAVSNSTAYLAIESEL